MRIIKTVLFLAIALGISFGIVHAESQKVSIGASPSIIENKKLMPGSEFSEDIVISRVDPQSNLQLTMEVYPESISGWISFDKGNSTTLMAGQVRNTIKATVKIPAEAQVGSYKGSIYFKLATQTGGQVTVIPGVKIDLDFNVGNETIEDLKIVSVVLSGVKNSKELIAQLRIQNNGNIPSKADAVNVKVFKLTRELVATGTSTEIPLVNSFSEDTVPSIVNLDNALEAGEYFAEISVQKAQKELYRDTVNFKIEKPEEVSTSKNNIIPVLIGISLVVLIGSLIGWFSWKKSKETKKQV